MRYEMKLRSVGNPDFGQYAPVSNPETVAGQTLAEMRAHCERYIEFWNLGGGNWTDPAVMEVVPGRKSKKTVGHFSYNGRLWSISPSKSIPGKFEEIKIEVVL